MKISLVEYGEGIELDCLFPKDDVSLSKVKIILDNANRIIQQALKIKRSPLVISEGKLRALGIAGTIRLSKDIQLEIIPKMLEDNKESDWKESLFLLAALSRYGDIITSKHINSTTAYKDSLYDIAGRILSREYLHNRRNPIRNYRKERFTDFAIDGEIDFNTVFEKNPEGIDQERVLFDNKNPFNATIQQAMKIVLPYVKDNSIRQTLISAVQELKIQPGINNKKLIIPSRNKEWNTIYNLSFDIVSGMGSTLDTGEILSPSFIVDTWRIWEWLITIAMRIGLGHQYKTIPQQEIIWGVKQANNKQYKIHVFPDVVVYNQSDKNNPLFLIDAKYKVLSDSNNNEIDRSDLYEAFAFCNALKVNQILLIYPAISDNNNYGNGVIVSMYEIGDIKVYAVKIAYGSITKQGDINSFCKKVAASVLSITNTGV